MRRFVVEF